MDIAEIIVTHFADPRMTIFDAPFLFMGIIGLVGYNRIQEPLKESDGKKFYVVLMVLGVLEFSLPFLLR